MSRSREPRPGKGKERRPLATGYQPLPAGRPGSLREEEEKAAEKGREGLASQGDLDLPWNSYVAKPQDVRDHELKTVKKKKKKVYFSNNQQ